jgi:hypothetical protein
MAGILAFRFHVGLIWIVIAMAALGMAVRTLL